MKRWIVTLTLTVVATTGVGFKPSPKTALSVDQHSVARSVRVAHAKELVGHSYTKSPVLNGETFAEIRTVVQTIVQKGLPAKYQGHVGAVTQTIIEEANRHGFDPLFLVSVIKTESQFNPDLVGGVGELGVMQIRPETAAWFTKLKGMKFGGTQSLINPSENIRIGAAYLAYLRTKFNNDSSLYVAAYNMGPTAVRRIVAENRRPQEYFGKVLKHYFQTYRAIGQVELDSIVVAQQ